MTNKEKKTLIGNKIFVEAEVDGQLILCALTRFEYLQTKLLSLKTGEYIKIPVCQEIILDKNYNQDLQIQYSNYHKATPILSFENHQSKSSLE